MSLYISVPFCRHKCAYCDLNAYAGLDDLIPAYVAALTREIRLIGAQTAAPVPTLYFGGGTPSRLAAPQLAQLLSAARESFTLAPDCEISLEANPETLTPDYLTALKELGINRLSLGAQSAQASELALFQRMHTWADVVNAARAARRAGFDNLSLDLIYGIPGQTLASWHETLQQALALGPDHFSVYVLSLDFNTPLRAWAQRGLLAEPDDDVAAEMYEWAGLTLANVGYEQYELSNWAKISKSPNPNPQLPITNYHLPPYHCRHNLQYWRNRPYLGLGAGAHGWWGGVRYANIGNPTAYVTRLNSRIEKPFPLSPAAQAVVEVDRTTEMKETLLTGLRLVGEGVAEVDFRARFGMGLRAAFGAELGELQNRQLIKWDERGARLTAAGRFVSNWVFEKFV